MEIHLVLAYLLIFAGLILLLTELILPTGGVLFALSVCALIMGVAMTFIYSDNPATGVITLVAVFVAAPALWGTLLHYWPRTRLGKHFFLNQPDEDATIAAMPVNLELEQLRGRFGRAVSALRPSGVADFGGRRIDVLTEGMLVEPGASVRCIDVRAGKVIVRRAEKPDLGDLENLTLG
jgi:membrane-bound serine protease (ClpP class)